MGVERVQFALASSYMRPSLLYVAIYIATKSIQQYNELRTTQTQDCLFGIIKCINIWMAGFLSFVH